MYRQACSSMTPRRCVSHVIAIIARNGKGMLTARTRATQLSPQVHCIHLIQYTRKLQ